MPNLLFELCAESVEAARAAEIGGADRIELCSALTSGGLTPDPRLTAASVDAVSIPVCVLVRPRVGNFVYSSAEFDTMKRQIELARAAGASGVALGVLLPGGRIDKGRTCALVDLARPMATTFHRAFDETPDLVQALEDVIETGADALLTSGGAVDVLLGADTIAELVRRAAGRIQIVAGGGLRLETLTEVVRRSGAYCLHGSLSRTNGKHNAGSNGYALAADVREAVRLLRGAFHATRPAEPT
jgi:copper homeostasis protein